MNLVTNLNGIPDKLVMSLGGAKTTNCLTAPLY